MSNCRTVLITLIALAITPMATAQVYKCDGPDGPVYSDRKCGPDATHVELSKTSGVSGVSDETKAELAEKKANREQAHNRNIDQTEFSNRNSTVTTEPAGRWVRNPRRLTDRDVSRDPKPRIQPIPRTGVRRRK
jgi:hypothetical protein